MLACRILNVLVTIFLVVTIPLQVVTTAVGGCLASLTLGFLLLPLSAVWMVFLGLLLGTSWLWDRAERLRLPPLVVLVHIPLAVVGIPLALLSAIYAALLPSMGDIESRHMKIVTCWVWPFSLDYWKFATWLRQTENEHEDPKVMVSKMIAHDYAPLATPRLLHALRIAGVTFSSGPGLHSARVGAHRRLWR
jgi:hypothetical protein